MSEPWRSRALKRFDAVKTHTASRLLHVLIAAVIATVGLLLDAWNLPLVDTFDKHIGDWRIALGSPRASAQRRDVTVVMVHEQTLLDYDSRSPIDRALLAELIRAIDRMEPRAVGLDIVLDRRTRHDAALLEAIKSAKSPIVLGSVDARLAGQPAEGLAIQRELIGASGRAHGHLLLARRQGTLLRHDSAVRSLAPPENALLRPILGGVRGRTASAETPPDPFADVITRFAGSTSAAQPRLIAWQRPPDDRTPLFPTLIVPRHKPDALTPALDGLLPRFWPALIKGRIVLIGAAMVDRDLHTTPLSVVDGGQTAGVYIHAQAIAQRLDGNRDVVPLPMLVSWLIAFGIAWACITLARHTGLNPQGFGYGAGGLVLLGGLSLLAYRFLRIDVPSIAIASSWAAGGFVGLFLNWLARGHDPPA